ncbi:hypothetical protein AOLI_G00267000 [Acnodon oligacanthus]
MAHLWHVVEFADSSTAAVPISWVENGKCLWPPCESTNIQRAVKQQIKPGLDWSVHDKIRCLATCDLYQNYKAASKALDQAWLEDTFNDYQHHGHSQHLSQNSGSVDNYAF